MKLFVLLALMITATVNADTKEVFFSAYREIPKGLEAAFQRDLPSINKVFAFAEIASLENSALVSFELNQEIVLVADPSGSKEVVRWYKALFSHKDGTAQICLNVNHSGKFSSGWLSSFVRNIKKEFDCQGILDTGHEGFMTLDRYLP